MSHAEPLPETFRVHSTIIAARPETRQITFDEAGVTQNLFSSFSEDIAEPFCLLRGFIERSESGSRRNPQTEDQLLLWA